MTYSISPCCEQSAREHPEAAFCTECGSPIVRCMAYDECNSILTPDGFCPACTNIDVSLDAGAAATVREGGKLALPLIIRNKTSARRPVFITGLWIREDDGAYRKISLDFERLDPDVPGHVGIRTGVLDHAGIHQVDVLIAVTSRYMWREETYVFSSSVKFPVEPKDPGGPQTHININADEIGSGFTLYNPTRIEQDRAAGLETHLSAVPLSLRRADMAERDLGIRGYEDGKSMLPAAAFDWLGFDPVDVVMNGPATRNSGLILCGRNGIDLEEGANDASLIVYRDGEMDERATRSISRHHFTLYPENGRLKLRADGQYGLKVGDASLNRTNTIELNDGDVIYPLKDQPDALSLHVTFDVEGRDISRIRIRRRPTAPQPAA